MVEDDQREEEDLELEDEEEDDELVETEDLAAAQPGGEGDDASAASRKQPRADRDIARAKESARRAKAELAAAKEEAAVLRRDNQLLTQAYQSREAQPAANRYDGTIAELSGEGVTGGDIFVRSLSATHDVLGELERKIPDFVRQEVARGTAAAIEAQDKKKLLARCGKIEGVRAKDVKLAEQLLGVLPEPKGGWTAAKLMAHVNPELAKAERREGGRREAARAHASPGASRAERAPARGAQARGSLIAKYDPLFRAAAGNKAQGEQTLLKMIAESRQRGASA